MNYKKFFSFFFFQSRLLDGWTGWTDSTVNDQLFLSRLPIGFHSHIIKQISKLKSQKVERRKKDKLQIDTLLIRQTNASFGHLVRSAFLWNKTEEEKNTHTHAELYKHLVTVERITHSQRHPIHATALHRSSNKQISDHFFFSHFQTKQYYMQREINTVNFVELLLCNDRRKTTIAQALPMFPNWSKMVSNAQRVCVCSSQIPLKLYFFYPSSFDES